MPNSLVISFEVSHDAIITAVSQIEPYLRNYRAVKPFLTNFEQYILEHFQRQNRSFFDKLQEAFQEDREASKMIEFLTVDLKDLKIRFIEFFDRHGNEWSNKSSEIFPVDFQQFSQFLLMRLKLEKEYLFPLLNKISS